MHRPHGGVAPAQSDQQRDCVMRFDAVWFDDAFSDLVTPLLPGEGMEGGGFGNWLPR